jgi:hypothetical protein
MKFVIFFTKCYATEHTFFNSIEENCTYTRFTNLKQASPFREEPNHNAQPRISCEGG